MGQQKPLSDSGNRSVWLFVKKTSEMQGTVWVMAGTVQANSDGGCIPGCGEGGNKYTIRSYQEVKSRGLGTD